ncbi:prepilin-type N-terminal cleavage/methylation domain-containing protein [bacterium]|nr:prepilin-type N-terminal cleavage/methylation domain-containing protein [bacterium]
MQVQPRRAFTLIELLIVVAIIAILAAIAVPNFLEAQSRSKVSRCLADMRTLRTGIEAYAVDWNDYPQYGVLNANGTIQNPHISPSGAPSHKFLSECLTTPLAYVTHLLEDPFVLRSDAPQSDWQEFWARYFYTNLDQFEALMGPAAPPVIAQTRDEYGIWIQAGAGPDRDRLDLANDTAYDPTNGTISDGDIIASQRFARF